VIRVECDSCEKQFEVDDDQQGMKVACPYCGDINRVDGQAAPAATPASKDATKPAPRKSASAIEGPEDTVRVVRSAMFRAHPLWYLIMLSCAVGGVVLTVFSRTGGAQPWTLWVGLTALTVGTLWWLIWWGAPHRWVKLTITTKRIIQQDGIVMPSEILHNHIRNIVIEQSVAQRMLGVGTLKLDSAGGSNTDPIEIHMHNVADPVGIRNLIDKYRNI
jgi:hypothetical protein